MTEKRETEQRDEPQQTEGINDPLVRRDVEAPRTPFEGPPEPDK